MVVKKHLSPPVIDKFEHRALLVSVTQTLPKKRSVYEAARFAWHVAEKRRENIDFVVAVNRNVVVGVFVREKWLPATKENFPNEAEVFPNRWGFSGHEAPANVRGLYLGRRLPDYLRMRGPTGYTDRHFS